MAQRCRILVRMSGQSDRDGRTQTSAGVGTPTVVATCCHYPKIGFARKPSSPLACSSSTIARPTAIMSATAASISDPPCSWSDTGCRAGPPSRRRFRHTTSAPGCRRGEACRPASPRQLDDCWAEVLSGGSELVHRHTLPARPLRHLGRLPRVIPRRLQSGTGYIAGARHFRSHRSPSRCLA